MNVGEPEVSGRVSAATRQLLWGLSAGRCHYCNKLLIGDLVSGNDRLVRALVAHIVSAKSDGPRGDPVRSPRLVDDISNLMLLCYGHHRLIDVEDVAGHPEQLLLAMKAAHEERITIQTSLAEDRQTHLLTFGAPIGSHEAPLSYQSVRTTVLPERYPAGGRAIHLEMKGCRYATTRRPTGRSSRRTWRGSSGTRSQAGSRAARSATCPCSGWLPNPC